MLKRALMAHPYPAMGRQLLTFGILRPLGVMLTASVVHDFAFEYGVLVIRDASGTDTPQPVERDVADLLFRDIISTVNRMPITAYVAWIFVRLGWFGIKYNGQPRGGAFPLIPVAIALAVLALVIGAIQQFWFGHCLYKRRSVLSDRLCNHSVLSMIG